MNITKTKLSDVVLIEPDFYSDVRGYFLETWNQEKYLNIGIKHNFVQDNLAYSKKNVLRGLHYQHTNIQGKLIYVLNGSIFDVAVDMRKESANFRKWVGVELSSNKKNQLYIPPGFAHGYCVLSDEAQIAYKCTDYYNPDAEVCIKWNDPDIAIDWPIHDPILSEKDSHGLSLSSIPLNMLPII